MWCRPEGALGLLPIAAASLSFPPDWWRQWSVRAVLVGIAALVLLRAVALMNGTNSYPASVPPLLGIIDWGTILSSTVLVPVWLWAPVPFAFPLLRRHRASLIALAGLAAGLTPVYLRGLTPDPAGTHLEVLRYGVPALAWLSLISAAGLDAACRSLNRLWRPSGGRRLVLHGLVALMVSSPVALHREYLARRYGHATSERAIRQLLPRVPEGCGLLVPDDFPEGVSIEIHDRYRFIAAEAYAAGESRALEVRPVSDLLEGKMTAQQCWTFLRGPYCYHGFAARPAEACERVATRFTLEEIAAVPIEFRHHRLVTGPDVQRAPWYMERMPVVLYRVAGRNAAD
jgi:hypothetical protein